MRPGSRLDGSIGSEEAPIEVMVGLNGKQTKSRLITGGACVCKACTFLSTFEINRTTDFLLAPTSSTILQDQSPPAIITMSNEQSSEYRRSQSPPRGDPGFENQDRMYYAQNREIQNAFSQEDHETVLRLVNQALSDPFLPRFYRAKFEVSLWLRWDGIFVGYVADNQICAAFCPNVEDIEQRIANASEAIEDMKQLLRREGRSMSPIRLLEDTLEGIRDSIEVVQVEVEVEASDEEQEEEQDKDSKDDKKGDEEGPEKS